MGWASEGGGKSDRSFDVQELNTQARIYAHLSLVRAEDRWSSASKRKGAEGGQKAGETDDVGLYRHTMGLPSSVLLHTCPPQVCTSLCVLGACFREWSFWKSMGATAWASEVMDSIYWSLR